MGEVDLSVFCNGGAIFASCSIGVKKISRNLGELEGNLLASRGVVALMRFILSQTRVRLLGC